MHHPLISIISNIIKKRQDHVCFVPHRHHGAYLGPLCTCYIVMATGAQRHRHMTWPAPVHMLRPGEVHTLQPGEVRPPPPLHSYPPPHKI